MTKLSEALQDFYERKGGRIFFQNGMSLNQLALEMWERLGYQEIDPSVISRVLKGERLFTPKQLKVFIQIFKLPRNKQNNLESTLIKDCAERFGLTVLDNLPNNKDIRFPQKLIEILNQSLNILESLRKAGNPESVQNLSNLLIELTDNTIDSNFPNSTDMELIYKIQSRLLWEKGHSLTDTCFPQELPQKVAPVLKKMEKLSKLSRDRDIKGFFFHLRGSVQRVCANYSTGSNYQNFHYLEKKYGEEALKWTKNPQIIFGSVNQVITGAAYLGDRQFLKKDGLKMVSEVIENYGNQSPLDTCYFLNCLAIAQSLISEKKAFQTAQKSWEIFNKRVKQPSFRTEAHLIRGTLQTMAILNHRDLNLADKFIQRADILSLSVFKRHQFFSHKYYNQIIHK